ncbi:hypothetical protein HC000_01965 [Pseudoalteromonas sp. MIP2626]|uniref:hypothetical protein n=1 Tax=Pseudoalteromonas sp. MIP2626 TaxID=2705464 RepID=UPI0015CA32A9|nr:hypothetical protein [Pseudoalteromonas sp. MIP2626]NYR11265.1 hypothetical protein [Pseudoalteromonas sp. MIP2626]
MSRWYRTGVVTLTKDSDKVIGVGTYWETAANKPAEGDMFVLDNRVYEVMEVVNDSTIVIDKPYNLATKTSSPYGIMRSVSATTNTRLAAQVSDTLEKLGNRVTTSTTAPSAGQGKDGDIWIVAAP